MLQAAAVRLKEILEEASIDGGHGFDHAVRVEYNVKRALESDPTHQLDEDTRLAVRLAALLHDADDRKFFPENSDYENARRILKEIGFPKPEEVIRMISLVSASKNQNYQDPETERDSPWLYYPRWADRIEAIGLIGIARCYAYTKFKNMPLFTEETPRVRTMEDLERVAPKSRFEAYEGKSESMVDHYYDKLIHLGDFHTKNSYIETCKKEGMKYVYDFVFAFGSTGNVDVPFLEGLSKKFHLK